MLVIALLLQTTQAAPADRPPLPPLHGGQVEMYCPIGGELFPVWRASSNSTFGSRPDAKPYTYLPFPFLLPECPTNELVAFGTLTADELACLPALTERPEYRRLVAAGDLTYFWGYWLASRLGRSRPDVLDLLLSAIWQVSPDEVRSADSRSIERGSCTNSGCSSTPSGIYPGGSTPATGCGCRLVPRMPRENWAMLARRCAAGRPRR